MAQLETLPDECLLLVLDWLDPLQLLKILRVNHRIKRLAAEKLRTKVWVIELWNAKHGFSECTHHVDESTMQDQWRLLFQEKNLHRESKKSRFLNILNRCSSIKSIDFGYSRLPDDLFLEVFRRCPQLECIKLTEWTILPAKWDPVFDEIGHRLVHLVKGRWDFIIPDEMSQSTVALVDSARLATVAEKCPNIRRVDWLIQWPFDDDLLASLKLLPTDCWVTLDCNEDYDDGVNSVVNLFKNVFDDVIDELEILKLNWTALGRRVDRLSSLSFNWIDEPRDQQIWGIEFAGLKRLEFSGYTLWIGGKNYLLASRFPRLEELRFRVAGIKESDYSELFKRMITVKRLTIIYNENISEGGVELPDLAAIHRLNKLEIIEFVILEDIPEDDWNSVERNFCERIEQYVDEISWLKKLIVKISECDFRRVEDVIRRLKLKQSGVEILCSPQ